MEYTIPKPAYNTPRRRITELRRVPNAIPFARYSTRLHRDCHEARAHSQWTPYANENENGRRLRTSGQMLRLTRIVLPSPPSFPSLYHYNSTKPPIKAADRRSRNPRTERRITCEARRRGYVSVSKKPVDHLRGSVKLEIICPFPSTIPACLAIIGEHRRERAKAGRSLEKGQSERGQTERGREKEENREKEREREGGRRIGGEREFKEREKRRTERMKNREEEEEEEKRGKIS